MNEIGQIIHGAGILIGLLGALIIAYGVGIGLVGMLIQWLTK